MNKIFFYHNKIQKETLGTLEKNHILFLLSSLTNFLYYRESGGNCKDSVTIYLAKITVHLHFEFCPFNFTLFLLYTTYHSLDLFIVSVYLFFYCLFTGIPELVSYMNSGALFCSM